MQIAKTLDTTDPNPTKNQGGIAILEPIAVATQQGGAEISQNGICPTVTAAAGMSGNNQPWIAFAQNQRDEVRLLGDKAGSLQAQPGMKQQTFIIDSIGGQAERGWEGEVAPTLKATHYKCPPCVMEAAGFKAGNGAKANGIGWEKEISPTFSAAPSGTNQVPSVCIRCFDARGNGDGKTVPTLTGDHENRVTDYTAVCVEPVPIHDQPVYCLQGNGIDRADTAGCNGAGWREGQSYTLNTIDRPAVAYATDVGFFNSQENVSPTLLARSYKDPHLVSYPEDKIHYIVRRLTPTECARLQGFPDRWGDINPKEDLTDEEYRFWLNVRNTHAAINGKTTKEYTKPQMLTWYSKLHTDSAEYKMWGNGIALPTALYVLQGIAEVSGL